MVVNQYSPLRLLGDRWRWGPFVRLSFRMGASLWFVASRRPSRWMSHSLSSGVKVLVGRSTYCVVGVFVCSWRLRWLHVVVVVERLWWSDVRDFGMLVPLVVVVGGVLSWWGAIGCLSSSSWAVILGLFAPHLPEHATPHPSSSNSIDPHKRWRLFFGGRSHPSSLDLDTWWLAEAASSRLIVGGWSPLPRSHLRAAGLHDRGPLYSCVALHHWQRNSGGSDGWNDETTRSSCAGGGTALTSQERRHAMACLHCVWAPKPPETS